MRFQARIIAVTLVILITALVLNSVLSLASFEKLYLTSLVSTIELAGKNLKRKVEQALRFGKTFENFKGLDTLLTEVLRDNPEISSVGVSDTQGKILYHTDEEVIGNEFPLPLPAFQRHDTTRSQLVDESYIVFLPLFDRSEELCGVIHLSFPRTVVTRRLQFMATENAKVLWIVVLLTSIGLIIGMTLWLTRPLRGKILEISNRLTLAGEPQAYERPPGGHDEASGGEGEVSVELLAPDLAEEARLLQADFLEIRNIKNELEQLERTVSETVHHCHSILQQHCALQEEERALVAVRARLEGSALAIRQLLKDPQEALSAEQQASLNQTLQENENLIKELQRFTKHNAERVCS
jgi:hypothetical protein